MIPTKRTMFVAASITLAASVLSLAGCGTTAPATETPAATETRAAVETPKYKVGDIVASQWTDGFWYPAKVSAVNGLKYNVDFDDGSKGSDYEEVKLQVLPADPGVKVGDKVLASWTGTGKLYEGTIQELKTGGAIVKWADGSEPSEVKFGKIIKK